MKYIIIPLVFLLVPLSYAETTFFDNPDDSFIMSDFTATSPTGEVTGGTTGGTTDSGGCLYKWNCTAWSKCSSSEKQTRNCTNIGTCPNRYKTPEIEQNCTLHTSPAVEEEKEKEDGIIILINLAHKNKIFIYLIAALVVCFIIFCLSKDYIKRLIKQQFKF